MFDANMPVRFDLISFLRYHASYFLVETWRGNCAHGGRFRNLVISDQIFRSVNTSQKNIENPAQ